MIINLLKASSITKSTNHLLLKARTPITKSTRAYYQKHEKSEPTYYEKHEMLLQEKYL
jgi:hypothetical protein